MAREIRRVALVSLHTSPVAQPGTADAGGLNVAVIETAKQLAALGIDVEILTRATGSPSVSEIADRITVRALKAGPTGALRKESIPEVADAFGEQVAILARESRFDVIHAHYWMSGLATLPVALELGIPFVQSFHTLAVMKDSFAAPGARAEPVARARSEAFLAQQSDAIIASSAAEVSAIIDGLTAPLGKVWVIPPGVDLEVFTPSRVRDEDRVRSELGVGAETPLLVVAGRVQPVKGQELAIRMLAEFDPFDELAPVLVVVGEAPPGDEAYRTSLVDAATSLGVSGRVRFVGALEREPLADLLAAATATIVPSHSETFGLVALESAASGTPVIGSRLTGLADSVAHGESGILLDSREPADWARAVESVIAARAHPVGWVERCRRHAEQFSWAASTSALLAVYASLDASGDDVSADDRP